MLLEPLSEYLKARRLEFDRIESPRLEVLTPLADRLQRELSDGHQPQIVFVCTHNSRRSHLAQLWTAAAAADQGLPVHSWSGGTEATKFDHRAVASLKRSGFEIEPAGDGPNAGYLARFDSGITPMRCFSKVHDEPPNPDADFIAVMVCNEADRDCPYLAGASSRFTIPFLDPKIADGTAEETRTYDERCRQVAREMLWTIDRVEATG